MKKLNIYIGMIICLISIQLHSQTSTFDHYFPNIGENTEGFSVNAVEGKGIIIGGTAYKGSYENPDSIRYFAENIDNEGAFSWSNIFDIGAPLSKRAFSASIIAVGNDHLLAATKLNPETEEDIVLIRLSSEGDTIWTKQYPMEGRQYSSGLIKANDGGYFVLAVEGPSVFTNSFAKTKLLKLNSNFDLQWTKNYSVTLAGRKRNTISPLGSNSYLITGSNKLLQIKGNGDSLRQHTGFSFKSTAVTPKNEILLMRSSKLEVYDSTFTLQWEKEIEDAGGFVISTSDGGILFSEDLNFDQTLSRITKLNEIGEDQWSKELFGRVSAIKELEDGYLFTGMNKTEKRNLWLLKTDDQGVYKKLQVVSPNGGEEALAFHEYQIKFISSDIENVVISFSGDNGNSWNEVAESYQVTYGEGSYEWGVPNTISDQCLIKITETGNEALNDISDNTFTIRMERDYDYIAVNEVKMWVGNNGDGSHDPITDVSGFYWPGGEDAEKTAVFEDGLIYGGKIEDEVRVTGNFYRDGLLPGAVLPNGEPGDPEDPKFKIYKIKKGWEDLPESIEKQRYEYDYNNWPVEYGAPWEDVNGDGEYTEGVDKPKFYGDETMYYVANDFDEETAMWPFNSKPLGLEFQTVVYGYDTDDPLRDVVFKKYTIINKGGNYIEDMYFSYWADPVCGSAGDDFIGCDSTLGLGYCYNSKNEDETYGSPPPAVGHMLLQGPLVEGKSNDTAIFRGEHINGYKNLAMNSFNFFLCCAPSRYGGPLFDEPLLYYGNMQGFDMNGDPYVNPLTGDTTKYIVSGDPVNKTGWYEGEGWPGGPAPGDRYYAVNSGPFDFAPGDTQEVVYALLIDKGENNIQSVQALKEKAEYVREFYEDQIVTDLNETKDQLPEQFALHQNYPNPFNPETKIKYTVGQIADLSANEIPVTLKIYDILGRKVKTVNKHQKPGAYEITFNAGDLPSGVYFYRLKAGDFEDSRKMILMK